MKPSRPSPRPALRGVARVSIAWLITFAVLLLAALFFAYIGFDAEAQAQREAEAARSAQADADARFEVESRALTELSRAVGFFDPEAATPRADPELIGQALEQLRATFPDLGADVKTLADALPRVEQAYSARGKELSNERDAKTALDSQMKTLEESLREALRQKDDQIADLQRQVQDAEANAAQKQTELENRIAALNTQRNQLDADLRAARAQVDEVRRGLEDEITTLQVRNANLTKSLAFLEEPEAVDARLLAVSPDLELGWIDIGARHRLARGTTFRVVSGRVGSEAIKAMATVTRVEDRRAEVRFYGVVDAFDPPVPGDVVYNPLFDPRGVRTAVLAGRFSGQFNEGELRVLLGEMGIRVQDQLGLDTDYLIVGSELYSDPETGEPLEEPLPVSDLAVYKDAEAKGVLIVSINDLRTYFQSL